MRKILSFIVFLFISGLTHSQQNFWNPIPEKNILQNGIRQIIPQKYLTYHLNGSLLKDKLWASPNEKSSSLDISSCIVYLPIANGQIQAFKVIEAPIMEPALAAGYPQIKTFSIKGIDDPYANGKLDWNEFGFHASIRSINGNVFIDPFCVGNNSDYIVYYTKDFIKDPSDIIPEAEVMNNYHSTKNTNKITAASCVGTDLRTYRLAMACTGEYAVAATGFTAPTVAQTLSKIVTSVNRIDAVYETELSVRLTLVATETLVIFTDAGTDPFTGNSNANVLINESQTVIDANILPANYDIGHTFSSGGGGLATVGCVCSLSKAEGITGSPSPVGDPYDIDYVCHEMGHQFNAHHSFNTVGSFCNGNRFAATAVEPGSGTTIMGYAGLCGSDNLTFNSIPYFHPASYDEIVNFIIIGGGNACNVPTSSGNSAPSVTASPTYTVPKSTPFTLTGSATDPNSDVMTYSWEEFDIASAPGSWNSGNTPYFMSYTPTATPSRTFPKLSVILSGSMTSAIGEYLPATTQTLNFRLTARDNKMGGGGVCFSSSQVIIANDGPLAVTYPNASAITWSPTSTQNITWNVNNTNLPPVSCASVNILMSTDGGNTFTMVIAANTPNDGNETITAPNINYAPNCRIKIQSLGNIFFDISDNDFAMSDGSGIKEALNTNFLGLSVSPNPFNSTLNVSAKNLNPAYESILTISDILGKTLKKEIHTGSSFSKTYDLENIEAGFYFIRLKNNEYQSVTRIIKQ